VARSVREKRGEGEEMEDRGEGVVLENSSVILSSGIVFENGGKVERGGEEVVDGGSWVGKEGGVEVPRDSGDKVGVNKIIFLDGSTVSLVEEVVNLIMFSTSGAEVKSL